MLPIRHGGYTHASKMQILMAYKCALVLRDLLAPYMLRRMKKDVQIATALPNKMEQVIFCALTPTQRQAYLAYLQTSDVRSALSRECKPFRALTILRQICNHPDLANMHATATTTTEDHDTWNPLYFAASGKMQVLQTILGIWRQQGHRVLLFAQHRKTLDMLSAMMDSLGYTHCRLDGTTAVRERQMRIDAFNDPSSALFIFLLTTKAGGIGVNLTGAGRISHMDLLISVSRMLILQSLAIIFFLSNKIGHCLPTRHWLYCVLIARWIGVTYANYLHSIYICILSIMTCLS